MGLPKDANTELYAPPFSPWLRRGVKARFILLGIYLLLTAAWYYIAFAPYDPLGISITTGSVPMLFVNLLLGTLFVFALQYFFLLGAPQMRWPRPHKRRPMFVSLAAGSAIAMLLSLGIVLAGWSLHRLPLADPDAFRVQVTNVTVVTTQPATAPATQAARPAARAAQSNFGIDIPWTWIAVGLGGWIFWFLIFALIGSAKWSKRFAWIYRILIAGTILELIITIPIDVQVRRRTQCYCNEGTFFSLIFGLSAILWTFGPGVAILFFVRRRQLIEASGRCRQCGYDLRGLDSCRCPECGTLFRTAWG